MVLALTETWLTEDNKKHWESQAILLSVNPERRGLEVELLC